MSERAEIEALEERINEYMAEIRRLRAALERIASGAAFKGGPTNLNHWSVGVAKEALKEAGDA